MIDWMKEGESQTNLLPSQISSNGRKRVLIKGNKIRANLGQSRIWPKASSLIEVKEHKRMDKANFWTRKNSEALSKNNSSNNTDDDNTDDDNTDDDNNNNDDYNKTDDDNDIDDDDNDNNNLLLSSEEFENEKFLESRCSWPRGWVAPVYNS